MKIYIKIYSTYKFYIKINFKIKIKVFIFVIIKKKLINYFNIKKILIFKNFKKEKNFLMFIHICNILNFKHGIKHVLKINHNSILENKINDLF